ncbi:hypothetical protein [Candidatus Cyanaurora vandensis]|nr:hypothetical protein [Candidatus Cyanaurora vandensis]
MVLTFKDTLTIPSTLAPGKYWLGAVLDKGSLISETKEGNNATYVPIQVY